MRTRVLTTATVLETGKGNFDIAIALGLILLALTFAINFFLRGSSSGSISSGRSSPNPARHRRSSR